MMNKFRATLQSIGPGILFATAAIGASHLVQSTSAGAKYGFTLFGIVVLTMLLKYPFFQYGPRYTVATKETLIDGYLKINTWFFALFVVITFVTMFTVESTVTLVAAGIAPIVTGLPHNDLVWSVVILGINFLILAAGRFYILDDVIKVVASILAICTLSAVVLAFFQINPEQFHWFGKFQWDHHIDVIFLIALIGWMPCPIDYSAWNSLWAVAKAKQLGKFVPWKQALFDFNLGYYLTLFLALCFLSLGALTIFGKHMQLPQSAFGFAQQLIKIYEVSLGSWAKYIIAIAAFTTMYSTTLTCLDAYSRVLAYCHQAYYKPNAKHDINMNLYRGLIILIIVGSLIIISFFTNKMRLLVTIAMVTSFLAAPIVAIMNYYLVTGKHMPKEMQPGKFLRVVSWLGILFLILFTIWFLTIASLVLL